MVNVFKFKNLEPLNILERCASSDKVPNNNVRFQKQFKKITTDNSLNNLTIIFLNITTFIILFILVEK